MKLLCKLKITFDSSINVQREISNSFTGVISHCTLLTFLSPSILSTFSEIIQRIETRVNICNVRICQRECVWIRVIKMERKRSVRRKPKAPFQRAMDHCRAFTAFMFSNVGITFLVVLYIIAGEWKVDIFCLRRKTITFEIEIFFPPSNSFAKLNCLSSFHFHFSYPSAGSILFPWIEKGAQKEKIENAEKARQDLAGKLWNITCCLNHMFNFSEFKHAWVSPLWILRKIEIHVCFSFPLHSFTHLNNNFLFELSLLTFFPPPHFSRAVFMMIFPFIEQF